MSLSEKSLIAEIRRTARRRAPGVIQGIGDDCAVLRIPAGHETLVTTDFSLEGVHFRRDWQSPEQIGRRCLTRGLSDVAAMGGEPVAAFLSLALPRKTPGQWVKGFMRGLLDLAGEFKISLAGGDTAESPGRILADIAVVGSVPKGKAILRSGARSGDRIYVTGELGAGAAAVAAMFAGKKLPGKDFPRYFHPLPRLAVGRVLRERGLASAMIDLSDGLSTDLGHICEESGVGAEIIEAAVPRAGIGKNQTAVDLRHALHGGDDYELLFSAPRSRRVPNQIAGIPVTMIGHITRHMPVFLVNKNGVGSELRPEGWEHFTPPQRSARSVTS